MEPSVQPMTTSSPAARRQAFTLVELLVVIAIVGVLLALVLPSFTGMGRGSAMRSASMQLRSTVSLARQWAITHREKTYIIFPDRTLDYSAVTNRSEVRLALRGYGVYAERSGFIKEWTVLPPGVIFNTNTNRSSAGFGDNSYVNLMGGKSNTFNNALTVFDLPFPYANSADQQVFALGFFPDGRSANTDYIKYAVYFSEGFTEVNTNAGTVTSVVLRPNGTTMGVEIMALTGLTRMWEL